MDKKYHFLKNFLKFCKRATRPLEIEQEIDSKAYRSYEVGIALDSAQRRERAKHKLASRGPSRERYGC